jgi:hypothetical protein
MARAVTVSVTRVLSSDDYGSSVERTVKLPPLWQRLLWQSSERWRQPCGEGSHVE